MQLLPCGKKNCKSKMTLVENNTNFLAYRCFEKPSEHYFRYNIKNKKWEKLTMKTKLMLNYSVNPLMEPITEEPTTKSSNVDGELEKTTKDQFQGITNTSNLIRINGIGLKRAEELESAGVKTVTDLAKRSPKNLAQKTGMPITQISNWIIEANKLTKKPIKIAT
jgi:predicted flap endonuclease-1-like 5' DNA nuclease